jgi:hypothetical protein
MMGKKNKIDQFITRIIFVLGISCVMFGLRISELSAQEKTNQNANQNTPQGLQRPQEVEFDARVIQGQRAEGAVYLFQRAPRDLPALLRFKKNNLAPIVEPLFGRAPVVELKAAQAPKDIVEEKNSADENQSQSKSPRQKKRKQQK